MTDNTWAHALTQIQREAVDVLAERRERVLAHPDLAHRLTQRPLRFARPEAWNGYVPPKFVPSRDGYRINDSPYRIALVDICSEAMRRHEDGGEQTHLDPGDQPAEREAS
ncbi:hypothetical protein [Actinomadura alba]|uniref:Uncharacterized protein n=1 Tax=Actinomadura alba TaxID=406431 RepID=A0ABR7LIM3_9ACTN|nr:hypothetical protein [Actinomadura alba]MBC6464278.1 hypothetical protein [Actinomadura alba]